MSALLLLRQAKQLTCEENDTDKEKILLTKDLGKVLRPKSAAIRPAPFQDAVRCLNLSGFSLPNRGVPPPHINAQKQPSLVREMLLSHIWITEGNGARWVRGVTATMGRSHQLS